MEATAQNIAIRSELITSLDALPSSINNGSFQEVENNFKRLEKELAVQQRALDEHNQGLTRSDAIVFTQKKETDILGILDAALHHNKQPALENNSLASKE